MSALKNNFICLVIRIRNSIERTESNTGCCSWFTSCCGGSESSQPWITQTTLNTAKYSFSFAFVYSIPSRRDDIFSELSDSSLWLKVVVYLGTEVAMVFGLVVSIVEGVVREALAWILFPFVQLGLICSDKGSFYCQVSAGGRLAIIAGLCSIHGLFQNLNPSQDMDLIPNRILRFHPIINTLFNLQGRPHSAWEHMNNCIADDPISAGLARFDRRDVNGQNRVYGVYIVTNETNVDATRERLLSEQGSSARSIHLGCATWHNFDIMCARRSTYGLIFDSNPTSTAFMKKTLEFVNACATREEFVSVVVRYLDSLTGRERELFFHQDQAGCPIERIQRELSKPGSWLSCDANYHYIREVASRGGFTCITEDLRNSDHVSEIRAFLDRNGVAIHTLYTSNIANFMRTPADQSAYAQSVRLLLNGTTLFIHCPTQLRQRCETPKLDMALFS